MPEIFPKYYRPPYHYGRVDHEYCIACWLGVGSNDHHDLEWGDESEDVVGDDSPS